MLPTLAKTDAVVIEHHDTEIPKMQDDATHEEQSALDSTGPVLPLSDSDHNKGKPPTIIVTNTDIGEMTPAIKPK